MKVEYKRDIYNNYMIFREIEESEEVRYGVKMILNNQIPGFLKVEQRIIDNEKQYYYDITAKQPLQWLFQKGQLTKEQIEKIMKGILSAVERAREYLLKEDDFILDPEFIYMNLSGFKIELCYRPGYGKEMNEQLCGIIEYMMDKVDYKEKEAVLFSYGLYKISREATCTMQKLQDVLEGKTEPYGEFKREMEQEQIERKREQKNKEREQEAYKEEAFYGTNNSRQETCHEEELKTEEEVKEYGKRTWIYAAISVALALLAILAAVKSGFIINQADGSIERMRVIGFLGAMGVIEAGILNYIFSDKQKIAVIRTKKIFVDAANGVIMGEGEPDSHNTQGIVSGSAMSNKEEAEDIQEEERTVILGSAAWGSHYKLEAVDKGIYEDILLVEFPFFIGKIKTKVDYAIQSEAISRFHAKLEQEGEFFYLIDLNSTNGTYVNGCRISGNEKKIIHIGDEISFANVTYQFIKI